MKNIYLCGFMGCGKSTVAAVLARKLGVKHYDIDQLIQEHCHMTISHLFEQYGEDYFRQLETQVLKQTGEMKGAVFATGGGILTNQSNGELIRSMGTLVYLKTPFEKCYQRIQGDNSRPLAVRKTKQELQQLFDLRDVVYQTQSDYVIFCKNGVSAVAEDIIKQLNLKKK